MRSLQDFATPHGPAVFQKASMDEARVVKVFENDPQANIRVFYYQYLKLCFELQNVNYQSYIQKIEQIINNQDFKFMFYAEDDPSLFNDLQFKQLIMEFFGVLGQGGIAIEQALNYYPIMDTVFIYFFRAILILTGKTDGIDSYIDRNELLGFLGSYFDIQLSVHDKCIKFVDTDVFVYEEDPKEVFMAYMEYDQNVEGQQSQAAPTTQQDAVVNQSIHHQIHQQEVASNPQIQEIDNSLSPPNSRRGNTEVNKSYVSSQFVDYTHPQAYGKDPQLVSMANQLLESGSVDGNPRTKTDSSNKSQPPNQIRILQEKKIDKVNQHPYQQVNRHQYQQANHFQYKEEASKHTQVRQFEKKEGMHYEAQSQSSRNSHQGQYSQKYGNAAVQPIYHSNQVISAQTFYDPKKPSTFDPKKPSTSYQSSQASKPYESKKPASSNPSASSASKPSSPPVPFQLPQGNSAFVSMPVGQNPFNLNVSLEFTNSMTMKYMNEPYKSNVFNIRNRARQYRDSLKKYLK